MNPNDLASALATIPSGRSAWDRAVHTYAVELVESHAASLVRRAYVKAARSEGGAA